MEKIDFTKVRESKIKMMKRFKKAYDKAVKEGTITYKKI